MNTLRWLFPPRNIQKEETRDTKKVDEMNGMEDTTELTEGSQSKPSYEAMTSAELIERVREEHEKLKKTQGQNQSQKLQLDTQNTALEKAYGEIEQYKATIANHEKTLTTQDQTISRNSARDANQKQQIQQLQTALKRSKKERQNLEQKFTNLNANHIQNQADHNRIVRSLHQTLDLTSKNLHDAQEANHDLKFDLELLRCTQNYSTQAETGPNSVGSFPAPPFVLVLVDGDAYEWAATNFVKNIGSPGAQAAQAIKKEVERYLLDNKERIPIQSRIVTRVFANFRGRVQSDGTKKAKHVLYSMPNIAKEFTESTPLFDYSDAGDGKERVDEKIKENFNLFISNPSCHTIFFAAAKDNGFARLLEQYVCNPEAKSKVVLVYPGYVARELAVLGYAATEWLTVFKRQIMSIPETRAAEKQQQKLEDAKNAFMAGIASSYGTNVRLPPPRIVSHMDIGIREGGRIRSKGKGAEKIVAEMIEEVD